VVGESIEEAIIKLEQEMMAAAEELEFERAAELRDRIQALKKA
jgi:excinuclease ABC subunit B